MAAMAHSGGQAAADAGPVAAGAAGHGSEPGAMPGSEQGAERVRAVREAAARAAAEVVGDGAGVVLLGGDGRYDGITFHHADPDRRRTLAAALDCRGGLPDDDYSIAMLATRQPIVLEQGLLRGVEAALLYPIVVDDSYLGYLVLVRTTAGVSYLPGDLGLVRDMTAELSLALSSTRSLARLRASEERFRRVLQSIPEGVVQLDPEGVVTFANEPVGVMLGLPCAQLVGLPMRGFLDARGQAELARRLAESGAGRATVGATRLMRADGSHRNVRISMMPLPDEQGRVSGSLCMMTDTTDQIDARGLKRQLDHLRRLDSLGQLIGGISHDFNNLLTVVAGSADMIASAVEPGSAEHQLATDIVRATVTGQSLTHQLLAFGRTDGNRPEVIPVPDLLNDIQSLLSRTLGEHIGVELSFGPDMWPVRAERGPLEQALVNLAANARDAMPNGGVLRVSAENAELRPGELAGGALAGRVVHLVITDTGAGMSEETRLRAFEPFFTTRPTSAGLGLATTAGILRGIGGDITLESQPRMGTAVHLYLPAAADPTLDGPARPAPATVIRDVLIVEDQPDVAALVKRLVEPAGFAVTVFTSTEEAVAQVAAGARPDLLITDVVMPAMTGPELAAALRKYRTDLPVIYMSGYTAAALGPQVQLDGNSVLVEKPFTRSTLLGAIRSLCGSASPPEQ